MPKNGANFGAISFDIVHCWVVDDCLLGAVYVNANGTNEWRCHARDPAGPPVVFGPQCHLPAGKKIV